MQAFWETKYSRRGSWSQQHNCRFYLAMDNPGAQLALVFSAAVSRNLAGNDVRLPPTYVGVRRIRPSNAAVKAVLAMSSSGYSHSNQQPVDVTYKVIDPVTREERRMTVKEKKAFKTQMKQRRKEEVSEAKKLARVEKERQEQAEQMATKKRKKRTPSLETILSTLEGENSRYLPFQIDPSALEEELADIKGERDGVPPVALSPPMARLALKLPPHSICVVDDTLAKEWAFEIKRSMEPAEDVRSKEDMRAMVYDLIPEVWSRMRPPTLGQSSEYIELPHDIFEHNSWAPFTVRPSSEIDRDLAAVVQVLHGGTNLHIACGAKFGCDFLLYNKSRNECHAFAGLKVLRCSDRMSMPIPTTYNITGYVRCLNTAAKLALLAFVQSRRTSDGEEIFHVAFVELPLLKIAPKISSRV